MNSARRLAWCDIASAGTKFGSHYQCKYYWFVTIDKTSGKMVYPYKMSSVFIKKVRVEDSVGIDSQLPIKPINYKWARL